MTNAELSQRWQHALMDNYGTPKLSLVRGQGAHVWDADGTRYLDFVGGIAVNALGHAHPAVVEAVSAQIASLGHVSNLFIAEPPVALAERLLQLFGRTGKVYFCNSGAEANEAAFKIGQADRAYPHGRHRRRLPRPDHGLPRAHRSAEEARGVRPAARRRHARPVRGRRGAAGAVTTDTALLIIEPIQGENGVVVPPKGYLEAAREITRATGTLLVLDEVQTGIGRCGSWFEHQQHQGVEPDLVTLAKGLGGGLPIGATVAFGEAAELLAPGQHGTTFGGNPVACAAGLAVLDTLAADGALDNVKRLGERIRNGVEGLGHPLVSHVRGSGLLLGIVLTEPLAPQVQQAAQGAGLLVNAPAPDVVRLMPPLIIGEADVDAFLQALPGALDAAYGDGRSGAGRTGE